LWFVHNGEALPVRQSSKKKSIYDSEIFVGFPDSDLDSMALSGMRSGIELSIGDRALA
jgi:hypothetical protein